MITDILEPVAPPASKRCNLLLHCGSSAVTRSELAMCETPPATKTWQPIPHLALLQLVEKALLHSGYTVSEQAHGLTHDGQRYFGLLEINAKSQSSSYCCVVGVRNSHDMRFSAGLVAGSKVLVCDNLSFAGEIQIARKHTPRIMDDLPQLAYVAVSGLHRHWHEHERRVHAYTEKRLTDTRAHDLVIRSVDTGVMANSYVPKVLQEWRKPRHADFAPRNVWSLQNAFTEVFKGRLDLLPERSTKLHSLLDAYAGVN